MTVPEIPEEIWEERGFKSKYSDNDGNCVEVVGYNGVVGVRDTKDPDGKRYFTLPAEGWNGLIGKVRQA